MMIILIDMENNKVYIPLSKGEEEQYIKNLKSTFYNKRNLSYEIALSPKNYEIFHEAIKKEAERHMIIYPNKK
jgi:hypothetical protein